MRLLLLIMIPIALLVSCKSDTTDSKAQKAASYPHVYEQYEAPKYPGGKIINDTYTEQGRFMKWVTQVVTEDSFDEISNYYYKYYGDNGWIIKQNIRKEQGEESEAVIIDASKGAVKHSLFIIKYSLNENMIKNTITKIDS